MNLSDILSSILKFFSGDQKPAQPPAKPDFRSSLNYKCLSLTGSFENSSLPPQCFSGLTGNFDVMGLSFGALQWNFGQGSLQPMLQKMADSHPDVLKGIFKDNYPIFLKLASSDKATGVAMASKLNSVHNQIMQPWADMFSQLGQTPEYQQIEINAANDVYQKAIALWKEYTLWSERGVALMFDIVTQDGTIGQAVKEKILTDFQKETLGASKEDMEVYKMNVIATDRSAIVNPKFQHDVLERKLCIAHGQGVVHGIPVDLAKQFNINLVPCQA